MEMLKGRECLFFKGLYCEKHKDIKCANRICRDFIPSTVRIDCKYYVNENECSVLRGLPCRRPRINKKGKPVLCTFFKPRLDGLEVPTDDMSLKPFGINKGE